MDANVIHVAERIQQQHQPGTNAGAETNQTDSRLIQSFNSLMMKQQQTTWQMQLVFIHQQSNDTKQKVYLST